MRTFLWCTFKYLIAWPDGGGGLCGGAGRAGGAPGRGGGGRLGSNPWVDSFCWVIGWKSTGEPDNDDIKQKIFKDWTKPLLHLKMEHFSKWHPSRQHINQHRTDSKLKICLIIEKKKPF